MISSPEYPRFITTILGLVKIIYRLTKATAQIHAPFMKLVFKIDLPNSVKEISRKVKFKKVVKEHLLQNLAL